jgi:hypothetical protein
VIILRLVKRPLINDDAMESFKKFMKPGTLVYTNLKHVSSSGMTRDIQVLVVTKEKRIWDISYFVAEILGRSLNRDNGGVRVGGAGMDMGFEIVYSLGYKLFPKGFKITRKNGLHPRNGDTSGFDKNGGYALRHQWI